MPPFLLVLAVLYLVGTSSTEPKLAELLLDISAPCAGEPSPIDEETLVRTLARHGVDLEREDACFGESGDPAAMFTNVTLAESLTPEADVVYASEGYVSCELHADDRYGARMTRRRGTEGVVIRVLNVDCTIDESDAWQVERLALAVEQLSREG
jgi:hypothetical protein